MSLSQWAEQQISIAKLYRNLSQVNPVTLSINSGGQSFSVVVSYTEPGFNVPFNVIWVNASPDFYGLVFRRLDQDPTAPFLNTWELLVDISQLFEQPQIWRAQDFLIGELERFTAGPASTEQPGIFTLTAGQAAVPTTAPELYDAREPLEHQHGPTVNRYLHVGESIIDIGNSRAPEAGDVLVVTKMSEDGILIGEWVKLAAGDISYDGPWPVGLTINGPSGPIDEMTQVQFTADLLFEDDSVVSVNPKWSLSNSSVGTLSENGVFQSYNIDANIGLRVTASYLHTETETSFTANFDFAIKEIDSTAIYESLEIVGKNTISKGAATTFVVNALFSNGSKVPVVPDLWTLSNSALGSITQNGIFTASTQRGNHEIRLTARYTHNGMTKHATFDLNIVDTTVYPATADIIGPVTLTENSSTEFQLEVTFENGRKQRIAVTDWGSSNANAGSIDRYSGKFVSPNLDGNVETIITASYTLEGVTVSAQKNLTVVDTTVYPESIEIGGAGTVIEGRSAQYVAIIHFTDGTITQHQVIWSIDSTNAGNIDPASGLFTAISDVSENTAVNISTSYTKNGKTVSASKTITVLTTQNLPVSAVISAPPSMFVGDSKSLTFTITYQDQTTARIKPQWSLSNTNIASISADGLLTALDVFDAAVLTVTGTYTASGATVQADATITINNNVARPISAKISGPTAVGLNKSANFALDVKFSDGATRRVIASWNSSNTDVGTISSIGAFVPKKAGNTMLIGVYITQGIAVRAYLEVNVT